MEGYDFFDDRRDDQTEEQTDGGEDWGVKRWSLGDHQEEPELDWDVLDAEMDYLAEQAPGLADALSDAKQITQTFSVHGFECPVCGLNHSHRDTKHDIREQSKNGFKVTDEFAEEMKFCPYCHCGVSELARLVLYFPEVSGITMFEDQHNFESVLELPGHVVRNIKRHMSEVTVEEANEKQNMGIDDAPTRKLSLRQAIEYERLSSQRATNPVPNDIRPDLKKFYDKVDRIQNAARGAPVPAEVENSLNENFGEL